MTQVDFYIISEANPQTEDVIACRLAEKALAQGYKILMLGADQKQLHALDEKLWTFKEQSFMPHEIVQNQRVPDQNLQVALSDSSSDFIQANLLINLSGKVPQQISRFDRIAEIVPARPQDRQQSRVRFKTYREQKFEIKTHEL